MFENNNDLNGQDENRFQSGSYYSPRSGYPGEYNAPEDPGNGKKPHKALKAAGVFAAIALLAYGSITAYQFAMENDSVRAFLGKSESSEEESLNLQTPAITTNALDNAATTPTTTSPQSLSLFDLAARENAMSIPDIVDKISPATVGVASTFVYEQQSYSFWGMPGQTTSKDMSFTGTGIIMSQTGYIITNAHVIYDSSEQYHMGLAKEVKVVLNDQYYDGETQLEATIVGYDVEEDIAVLKVNTDRTLTVADFGDSDDLRVGELVVAIGNPLGFELFGSVTTGIVSALDREVTINDTPMRLIQTDTAINSGNSGGPLINSCGQIIGINSSKISSNYMSDSASVEGLCFAIPIAHAKSVIDDLINYGYVTGKPLIGISGRDISKEISEAYGLPVGIYVSEVTKGGAADLAGVRAGDIIIAVDGEAVSDMNELNAMKDKHKAGENMRVTITRSNQDYDLTLVLQEKKPAAEQ